MFMRTALEASKSRPVKAAEALGALGRISRLVAALLLGLGEIFLTTYLFYFPTAMGQWLSPVAYAKKLVIVGLLSIVALALVAWPRRHEIAAQWLETAKARRWLPALAANLALFGAVVVASMAISYAATQTGSAPWALFGAFCVLLLLTGVSLALIAAPLAFWRWLAANAWLEIGLAFLGSLFAVALSELTKESWNWLAWATLVVSRELLSLFESDVFVDMDQRILGAGQFKVSILPECSGYEGIGLIVSFLTLYLWLFRRDLKFPNAFALIPIGIVAIWLLNAARIAALIGIGAHLSPEVAFNGFHSQAGWIAFLFVTIGTMYTANRLAFFSKTAGAPRTAAPAAATVAKSDDRMLLAFLAPFMALMISSIAAATAAPNDQWFVSLKIAMVAYVLWLFRDVYAGLLEKVSLLSLAAGLLVGVAWIATDPAPAGQTPLGAWIAGLPAAVFLVWIVMRAAVAIVFVPIAEELAFRGYLHRALISAKFETVEPAQFSWLAFVVSSALFGLMHQRWLAGMLAGAVYALVMYRSNRISDPVAAHMVSNAVIVAWAIAASQWSLL
jgi:exosortase E/protease (VPEID-CTERM system)